MIELTVALVAAIVAVEQVAEADGAAETVDVVVPLSLSQVDGVCPGIGQVEKNALGHPAAELDRQPVIPALASGFDLIHPRIALINAVLGLIHGR